MNKAFHEMQQDAVNRVRDMQRRARETVGESSEKAPTKETAINKSPISRLFDLKNFKGSQEDILILSLIVLLADEGADMMLVLALLYLIM